MLNLQKDEILVRGLNLQKDEIFVRDAEFTEG